MKLRIIGYVLIVVAFMLVAYVTYRNIERSQDTLVFAPNQLLGATWGNYKAEYLEEGSRRTLDKQRDNITTSEGQSYTMLRAAWMGDKETFDVSWQWTKDNLAHADDHLFSWLFGERRDGTYGVLTEQNGNTSASDGDTDIAVALLFAYARWQDEQYLGDARNIIRDIWEYEVIEVGGIPYLASNNLEKFSGNEWAMINPSYFHPAAYRIFAKVDSEHDWEALADSTYDLLQRSIEDPLNTGTSAGLPPDWMQIHKETGELRSPPTENLTTNFGWDALRMPWRIALDYQWFGSPEARSTLESLFFLSEEWRSRSSLASVYSHDGDVISGAENPAMYGGTIGYFLVADPSQGEEVYKEKLAFLFDPGENAWREELSYYDENWAWFGIGLYNNLLPDLTATMPEAALTV